MGYLHGWSVVQMICIWSLDFVQDHLGEHQKGKTNLDLLEQEIVSGNGISWTIRKSAP